MSSKDELVFHVMDATALGGALLAFLNIVPSITAVASLIYILLRIFETKTVRAALKIAGKWFFG